MKLLDAAAVNFQAVLTKTDGLREAALAALAERTAAELREHPAAHPAIAATSARKGVGIAALRAALAALAAPPAID